MSDPPTVRLVARAARPTGTVVEVRGVRIGGPDVVIIAGPCAVESEAQLLATARAVKAGGASVLRGGAFKPRTSPYSFRGLELEGLRLLALARAETGLPVVTEVMDARHLPAVAECADILQVGSRNMQNFTLLEEVGRSGLPVLLKRGMSATIAEYLQAAEYVMAAGNPRVILCERGIRTFETSTRNTLDLNAVPMLHRETHLPVLVDPSHGTGHAWMVPALASAAVAAGADGLLIEVHCDPGSALSDGINSLTPEAFAHMVRQVAGVAGGGGSGNRMRALPASIALATALAAAAAGQAPSRTPFESNAALIARNGIDQAVFARLKRLGIEPARLCSDGVFLRRAFLDVIGTVPTADEARAFLDDPSPNKRSALVDRLLERDEFADYWAMKWGDVLRVKSEFPVNLWPNAVQAYHRWVRTSLRDNLPYDRFARALLTSSGSNFRVGPVNFYRAAEGHEPKAIADVRRAGVHGEPPRGVAARAPGADGRVLLADRLQGHRRVERGNRLLRPGEGHHGIGAARRHDRPPRRRRTTRARRSRRGSCRRRTRGSPARPSTASGSGCSAAASSTRRTTCGPTIRRRIPNCSRYLEREFVASRFDVKALYRSILNSTTYQLSSIPAKAGAEAEANFALRDRQAARRRGPGRRDLPDHRDLRAVLERDSGALHVHPARSAVDRAGRRQHPQHVPRDVRAAAQGHWPAVGAEQQAVGVAAPLPAELGRRAAEAPAGTEAAGPAAGAGQPTPDW